MRSSLVRFTMQLRSEAVRFDDDIDISACECECGSRDSAFENRLRHDLENAVREPTSLGGVQPRDPILFVKAECAVQSDRGLDARSRSSCAIRTEDEFVARVVRNEVDKGQGAPQDELAIGSVLCRDFH